MKTITNYEVIIILNVKE